MGLLLVGERSRPETAHLSAFEGPGSSGRRLAWLFGSWPVEGVEAVNLYPLAQHSPAWVRWRVYSLARENRTRDAIICCGRSVAHAFGLDSWLTWEGLEWEQGDERGVIRLGAIPHPSGRCRYWNDAERAEAARRFVREALDGIAIAGS